MHSHKTIIFCLYSILGLTAFFSECSEKSFSFKNILNDQEQVPTLANWQDFFQPQHSNIITQSAFKKIKNDNLQASEVKIYSNEMSPEYKRKKTNTNSNKQNEITIPIKLNYAQIDTKKKYDAKYEEIGDIVKILLICNELDCTCYRTGSLSDARSAMLYHRKIHHSICKCNQQHKNSKAAINCKDCRNQSSSKIVNDTPLLNPMQLQELENNTEITTCVRSSYNQKEELKKLRLSTQQSTSQQAYDIPMHLQQFFSFLDVNTQEKYQALANKFKNEKPSDIKISCDKCNHNTPNMLSSKFHSIYVYIISHRLNEHFICNKCNIEHESLENALKCSCKEN